MKKTIFTLLLVWSYCYQSQAQDKFGQTLNLGLGLGGYSGYYSYTGHTMPVLHVDYEFDVARNFTLAPFVNFYTFSNSYYWGDNNHPNRYYNYTQTVIPIGVKGTYYFDELLNAGANWDFYIAGSLGFAIINSTWDNGYGGNPNYYEKPSSLFLDLHIGTEYHFSRRIGVFLDLSTGVSTIGLAIHR